LEDVGVDGRMILSDISEKQTGKLRIVSIWFRTKTSGELL
jgi:hypothetical protein